MHKLGNNESLGYNNFRNETDRPTSIIQLLIVSLKCPSHCQFYMHIISIIVLYMFYSVLVSVSCPKALYHLESDNLFRITVVVADWLG